MKIVGWTVVVIAFGLLACLLQGWVLSILWGWFVAPVFGLPYLTTVQGVGLAVFFSFILPSQKIDNKNEGMALAVTRGVALAFGAPLMSLAFGWLVYAIFM